MNFKPHNRRSIRIKDYNYSNIGMYFVTICVQNKAFLFGDIVDNEMILSDIGETVKQCWLNIPLHFPNVKLHYFVVMPNHIHGIIEIFENGNVENGISEDGGSCRGTACRAPTVEQFSRPVKGSIPTIIRSYKSAVTKQIHENGFIGPMWQRNYYEHIIRDEEDYINISNYIKYNPVNWEKDKLYVMVNNQKRK